ncbi:hypothetical protein GW796_06400 [archaeon]|nr:hypothetical protein [archaeon]
MSTNISSNFNIDAMISAMMMPIQAKITVIDKNISSYEIKLSDIGKLKSSISALKTDIDSIEGNQTSSLPIDKLKSLVNKFVTNYNASKVSTKNSNDYSLRKFSQKLRTELNPNLMNTIGLSFDKNGMATFNEIKFDSISLSDPTTLNTSINDLFDTALASGSSINSLLQNGGKLDSTEELYTQKLSSLNNKKDVISNQVAVTEVSYRRQFSALEKILNQLDANQNVINNFVINLNTTH